MSRRSRARTGRAFSAAVYETLEDRRLMSVNVTTYHYDNSQQGSNTNETALTLADVNTSSFGKIASMAVDGQVYAQPLVLTGVTTPSYGNRDVVFVATESDSVYAFDAYGNNPAQGYLWKTSLKQAGETAVPQTDYGTNDITATLGVTGTPVIDATTGTLYVVGFFKEANATYQQRIYALDVATGTAKLGGPTTIAASVPGTGDGSVGGILAFDPYRENQRPALTLANGEVYVGYASHGDESPWHGWLLAFNAATLHMDYAYCNTPNAGAGGIWMSGGGIAVDSAGNLYFSTGNGDFDVNTGGKDYGMTIEKVSPSLVPLDYFAPYNWQSLSNADLDYGCSSVIVLSNQTGAAPNQLLTESKWGTMYLNNANTGSMGEFTAGTNHDLGEGNITTNVNTSNVHQTMAYWNGHAYIGGDALKLQMFNVSGGTLTTAAVSQTTRVFGNPGAEDGQGAGVSLSSNGTANGILWALDNTGFTANPAVLYAYNASNLGQMLWNSGQAAGNAANNAVKFTVPVVANGYVYTAGAGSVTIFGLRSVSTNTPTIVTPAAASPTTVTGNTTNLSVAATDPSPDLAPVYSWAATNTPAGAATPAFSVNGSNAANNTTATFFAAGNYTFTVTVTDPNSGLTAASGVNVTVAQTLTGLTVSPTATYINVGTTQQLTATTVDQFGNAMTTQPAFTWTVAPGGIGGTVSPTGLYTAPSTGTGSDTVTVTSGTLSASTTITAVLTSATIPADLTGSFNEIGVVTDYVAFVGGLDGGGAGLSGALLGTSQTWNGSTFTIAPATANNNVNNVVDATGQTIPLNPGNYASIKMLATHVNGNTAAQTVTVTYTDGTTQNYTQGFSDWYTPQNYAGESTAVTMAYRDNANGTRDARTFYVYGYKFALDPTKKVQSIKLPNDNLLNVVAIDLVGITSNPTVTTPAAATPSPVTGTTATLSVTGASQAGDPPPVYSWAATNAPAGATTPTFAVNNSASAGTSTVTFYQAGSYTFTVAITDPATSLFTTSAVTVAVNQTLTAINLNPAGPTTVADGQTKQFTATAVDQFGATLAAQPTFTWAVTSGSGSISSTGLYTAPTSGVGSATITATAGTVSTSATVNLVNVANASFYPVRAGWYRAGVWQGINGNDGGTNYNSPAGGALISKNPNGGTLRDSYLLFNISNGTFAGDTINSVTITFNAAAVNQAGPVAIGVYTFANTSWGATTADPAPAPTYTGATLIGATQNVGGAQGVYASYTFNLAGLISNTTNGLISLELNSPAATAQETGFEVDAALNTPGIDPVITVNYSIPAPAWLGAGSQATWNAATKVLSVTGPTTIIADPGTDQPLIQANGPSAVVTVNPTTALQIHVGGLTLTNGAVAVVTSLGVARTAANHRVLVIGQAGATTVPPLSIDSTSKLDSADNDLVDHGGSLSAVNTLLTTGLNAAAGYWNGAGVDSSTAAAGSMTALGETRPAAGTVDGEAVAATDVVVRYAYYGDANLDGKVDGSDYTLIDNGFTTAATGWQNGDFNYDGHVDGSDYSLIDNAYNRQGTQLAQPSAAVATAAKTVAFSTTPIGASNEAAPLTATRLYDQLFADDDKKRRILA